MSEQVKIVEVGPRDGLQNEKVLWTVEQRAQLIQKLIDAGLKFLEAGSFVSPKAIPAMQNSGDVFQLVKTDEADLGFLVPNLKGFDAALKAGVRSIAIFTATSDSFNQKNIKKNVDESLSVLREVAEAGLQNKMRIRGYVSTAFGCPYEGKQDPKKLVRVIKSLFEMGSDEVSIGDTIGVAHPKQVKEVISILRSEFEISKLAAHLHDTRGFALANIQVCLEQGIRIFDSSVGGLGGCPYAKGASGNVATEEVVHLLNSWGFACGVDERKLLELTEWISKQLKRPLRAKLQQSGPKLLFFDRS